MLTLRHWWINRKDETDPRAPVWPHKELSLERKDSPTHTGVSASLHLHTLTVDWAGSATVISLQWKRRCPSDTSHLSHVHCCSSLSHSCIDCFFTEEMLKGWTRLARSMCWLFKKKQDKTHALEGGYIFLFWPSVIENLLEFCTFPVTQFRRLCRDEMTAEGFMRFAKDVFAWLKLDGKDFELVRLPENKKSLRTPRKKTGLLFVMWRGGRKAQALLSLSALLSGTDVTFAGLEVC